MPRGSPYKYTKEQIIEAFRLRDQGLSIARIAERTGVGRNALSKFFRGLVEWFNPKHYGFELPIPKREQNEALFLKYKDDYISLWEKGLSHPSIWQELDTPEEYQGRISCYLYDNDLIERRTYRGPGRNRVPLNQRSQMCQRGCLYCETESLLRTPVLIGRKNHLSHRPLRKTQ